VKEKTWEFLIAARRGGKLVCGYGAPAKGNTFLNYCGIGRDHLAFTVDRNRAKPEHAVARHPYPGPSCPGDFPPQAGYVLTCPGI